MDVQFFVYLKDRRMQVELKGEEVRVDGTPIDLRLHGAERSPVRSGSVGTRPFRTIPSRHGRGDWTLEVEGIEYRVRVGDRWGDANLEARRSSASETGAGPLRAPMPGLVVRVQVSPGEDVHRGDPLVIVEAMKMENQLRASEDGRVLSVGVTEGETVEKDQVLVEFEPIGASE